MPPPASSTSIDLWKFFEDRGSKLKDSMFGVVTWIVGLASAVLGFAVKEGFATGSALTSITHPVSVVGLSIAGLLIVRFADIAVRDYGEHINRTFNRANAARNGESSPRRIWDAGQEAVGKPLPLVCRPLRRVLGFFAAAFLLLLGLGLFAMFRPPTNKKPDSGHRRGFPTTNVSRIASASPLDVSLRARQCRTTHNAGSLSCARLARGAR